MSIFSTILNKIFPHEHPANTTSAATPAPAATAPAPGTTTPPAGAPSTPSTAAAQPSQPSAAPMPTSDIGAVLTQMQEGSGRQLNRRTSIVDLLKLVMLTAGLRACPIVALGAF